MVNIQQVTKRYAQKNVVDQVTVEIQKGKITSLIGANGAGKSTLLSMISRLIGKDAGEVWIEGTEISQWNSNELAKKLSILKQSNFMNIRLTVRELVSFGRFPYSQGKLTKEDEQFVTDALTYMELTEMKKRVLFTLFSLVLLLALAACGGGEANTQPVQETGGSPASGTDQDQAADETEDQAEDRVLTITHQLGETDVPFQPERVVVFDYGVLDSLDKLGVKVTGVPQSHIPPYLEKYADSAYENVGSLFEADFEKISEIDPDLIIISGRMSDSYDELTKLGATIFLGVDSTRYMESYKENARVLGQIFGKEDEVEQEIAEVEALIADIHEKVVASGSNALVILANEGNISAYGVGSRFGMIYDDVGFIPVDENIEVSTHGMSVSFEYVVEKNPDYLFVVDRGAVVSGGESTAKQLIENELVGRTKAYQEGNIIYLDPNYWYVAGGGLISVAEMMKELDAALQ